MKLKQILNIIKQLKQCKDFIIYMVPKDIPDNDYSTIKHIYSDNIDEDTQAVIFNDIKENLIEKIGTDKYGEKLELYDKDLYDAYMESKAQRLKASYFETAYEYYKQVNDPNGGDANRTYSLYKRLLQLRDKYEKYLIQNEQ